MVESKTTGPEPDLTNRGDILRHVALLITGERNNTHGSAVEQLTHAAKLKEFVGHRLNPNLAAAEVEAIDMICVKLSRLAHGKPVADHYMDIAGYAAIAAEALARRPRPDAVKAPEKERQEKLANYRPRPGDSWGV